MLLNLFKRQDVPGKEALKAEKATGQVSKEYYELKPRQEIANSAGRVVFKGSSMSFLSNDTSNPLAPIPEINVVRLQKKWTEKVATSDIEKELVADVYRVQYSDEKGEETLSEHAKFHDAYRAFDAHVDQWLEHAIGFVKAPVHTAVTVQAGAPKKSFLRRMLRGFLPWFGGAAIVIIASLSFVRIKVPVPQQGQGAVSQTPAAVSHAGLTGDINDVIVNGNGPVPDAWNKLTPEQKVTMLRIAEQAAQASGAEPGEFTAKVTGKANLPILDKLPEDQLKKVKAAYSIKQGKGSKIAYVFEDPMCSACQHFAGEARGFNASYGVQVIPIGFQQGGRDRAAAALCSKDVAKAWDMVMAGLSPEGKPCPDGYKKIDENNALFTSLGMNSTPTSVAPNGSLAQGSADAPAITAWIDKNQ